MHNSPGNTGQAATAALHASQKEGLSETNDWRYRHLADCVRDNAPLSAQDKPNMLIIWGDDVGQSNISAYTMGLMGYRTANIDRVARDGMIFTDYYGEQSCTAGRSSYITGQSVFRTGLSKVGMQEEDPTFVALLR
jgi:hypothetical protein